jgi:putative membrane protein
MKRMGLAAVALATVVTVACGGADRDARDETAAIGTSGEAREVEGDDREFLEEMIEGNMAEVELGRLGVQKSGNPEIRKFGEMLIADHTRSMDKLKALAASHSVPAPGGVDGDNRELMDRLSKLNGAEFDREYIDALVDKHENTIDALEPRVDAAGALGAKEGAVTPETDRNQLAFAANSWAAEALPTVRLHRDHAKQLQDTLQQRRNTTN